MRTGRLGLSEWSQSRLASTSKITLRTICASSARPAASATTTTTIAAGSSSLQRRGTHILSCKPLLDIILTNSSLVTAYPFSPDAVIRSTDLEAIRGNANVSPNHTHRGVMAALEAQLKAERDPQSRFTSLFLRSSKDQIPPGSVLTIETYTNATKTSFSTFSGVLIAIRRRGLSTSFVLRNIVSKLGVEIRFNLYSPLLKDIKVIQRAIAGKDNKKGGLRRARRAKLYYLRNDDRKLSGISKSVAALRTKEAATKAAAAIRKKPPVKDRR